MIGSPSTHFDFDCSMLYARSLLESSYPSVVNNTNILCVVHPDGLWSFPLSLSDNETNNCTVATEEAVKTIKTINPAVMVQHILCSKRHVYNALFEILNIPYIGSDSHVSANMVDKGITRAILLQSNVPVPSGLVLSKLDDIDYKGPFPAVVKPTKMENSVGVSLVLDKTGLDDAMQTAWKFGSTAIIDTFIAGREVRCGAIELEEGKPTPLGCIEYQIAKDKIRRYEDKLQGGDNSALTQATYNTWFIDETREQELVNKLQNIALKIHRVMGCRDFSQFDCRVTEDGEVFVLEVQSFCSFGPISLLPKLAARQGISPEELYSSLLENAVKRGAQ